MHHAGFVHLHLHTYYSLLDGAIPIAELAKRAKAMRMPAIAMTDHGNLFGAVEFYETMEEAGIKPIIGCEAYLLTHAKHTDRSVTREGAGFLSHLTLLATNRKGYQNLCLLSSVAHMDGFYYKPRIDKELLAAHSEGLIACSGCLRGEVPSLLARDDCAGARAAAEWYARTFGEGHFYLELMRHGLPDQPKVVAGLLELGRAMGLPVVATNDCHYIEATQAGAHDALLCIQTGKTIADTQRLRMEADTFFLRSPAEMSALFPDCPEAIANTVEVAERCNLSLDFTTYHFPRFAVEPGKDLQTVLGEEARIGLRERWPLIRGRSPDRPEGELEREYTTRLEEELSTIGKMGFAGYFLIVADFIRYAKGKGIPVGPGRGSAVGSLVTYCLKINDIDPLPYGLFFERFLNPERVSLPDMDIDFCMRRRAEVIRYVAEKYGNVSQIITFGKMKAKAAVRDVGRVMGLPYGDVDRIAKLIPNTLHITLEQALQVEPQLKTLVEKDEQIGRLMTMARMLEGFPRHASTHAAGVVISDQPLTNFLPLYRGQHEELTTQFDMKAVEKVGLIKFDFLGLKTLTVLADAVALVGQRHGVTLQLDALPLDDQAVFTMLGTGDTVGIFQLESSGMTDLVARLKPTRFEEIVALVALFRPGPLGSGMVEDFINRKHGRTRIEYPLPALEPILKETYGVILYQEQVMQIASMLANYTMGEADILRRAMGKKKPEEMREQQERFLKGCAGNNISARHAERIFALMEKFAGYGFNKCVVGDTEVIDAESGAVRTVEELYREQGRMQTVTVDDEWRISSRPIDDIHVNGIKPVYEVRTHLGHTITVTDTHPFLACLGWRELRALTVGDRIGVPRCLPCAGRSAWQDYHIITLAGLLSEGNLCHPTSLYFYNNDASLIHDFVSAVSQFPQTVARIDERSDGRLEVCVNTGRDARFQSGQIPWNTTGAAIAVRFAPVRSGAYEWAASLGLLGQKAAGKVVPKEVFRFGHEQLALFVGRLWSGDGFVFGSRNSVPYYATASYKLAKQLQHLLLRLGMVSRLATKRFGYRGGERIGYALYLTGHGAPTRFLKVIAPHMVGRQEAIKALTEYLASIDPNRESRDTIPREIKAVVQEAKRASGYTWASIEEQSGICMKEFYGALRSRKRGFRRATIEHLGSFFHHVQLLTIARSDVYWDEIVSIEPRGVAKTYDLSVRETHNFVANNIIVHNSHSVAYAMVAYQTAYCKRHYPTEYMAALLTSEMGDTDKILTYLNDAKAHGLAILPPDVNESAADFTVIEDRAIRFGLAAVKHIGTGAIESIVEARHAEGPFRSFGDLCERVDLRRVNRRVIESLIKCGACDRLGGHRAQHWEVIATALLRSAARHRERAVGQGTLFSENAGPADGATLADVGRWPEHQLLQYEKEALGFYITGHPLAEWEGLLHQYASHEIAGLKDAGDGREARFGGVVATLRETTTRRGDRMAFATIEDLRSRVEVVVFADVYQKTVDLLKGEQPLFVIGTTDVGEEVVKVIAKEILPMGVVPERLTKGMHLRLSTVEADPKHLQQLKVLLHQYAGSCPVYLHVVVPDQSETVMAFPKEWSVKPSLEMVATVEKLFGHPVARLEL